MRPAPPSLCNPSYPVIDATQSKNATSATIANATATSPANVFHVYRRGDEYISLPINSVSFIVVRLFFFKLTNIAEQELCLAGANDIAVITNIKMGVDRIGYKS